LDRNPVGEVFGADILYVLGPRIKRGPDVSVVMRPFDPRQEIQGAPELAIEILSPSNRDVAMRRKVAQYFSAGCKLLWIVDSDARSVEVWTNAGGPECTLGDADTLRAAELLPGFSMPVSALF
jgi:Uma2 family endonuclease